MSHKDFIKFAQAFAQHYQLVRNMPDGPTKATSQYILDSMMDYTMNIFKKDTPSFDAQRFATACKES